MVLVGRARGVRTALVAFDIMGHKKSPCQVCWVWLISSVVFYILWKDRQPLLSHLIPACKFSWEVSGFGSLRVSDVHVIIFGTLSIGCNSCTTVKTKS